MNAMSRPALIPAAAADPRVALRQAIAVAAEAAARATQAASVAERGNALADSAADRLARFVDLDGLVAEHNAGLIRAGSGRTGLPPDLVQRRREKAEAAEALADAVAAAALLAAEAQQAATAAEEGADAMDVAGITCMAADARKMLAQMRELEEGAALLRASLAGFCTVWSFTDQQRKPSPMLSEVWLIGQEPQHAAMIGVAEAAGVRGNAASDPWRSYRARLRTDADAALVPSR